MKVDANVKADTSAGATTHDGSPDRLPVTRRRFYLLMLPAVGILIAGVAYLLGGRNVETDDAFIKAEIAAVSPDVSGAIVGVMVGENQKVAKGQPLVAIDPSAFQIAMARAQAALLQADSAIAADKAKYRQKQVELQSAETKAAYAGREYDRQAELARTSATAAAKLDAARRDMELAQDDIALLKEESAEILARLQGNPDITVEDHPSYMTALAEQAAAQRMLNNTMVKAPFDGVVSQLPKVGDYARSGAPLLSLVSVDAIWVEANFKETDLTHVRPGQAADVSVDTYPGRVWHGHVQSISQATGAEFALLPAQNSTGNWVKIVQRVPVRILLDDKNPNGALRSGMSVVAEVDTMRNRLERLVSADSVPPAAPE